MSEKNKKFSNQRLEKSEKLIPLEDEVLAVISHELLTPINTIAGWTKILQNENLNEHTKKTAFLTIEKQIHSHTELIDNLIDYSKIASKRVELNKKPNKFSLILDKAIDEMKLLASEKNIEITQENSLRNEICVCEEASIYKALMNVFRNAVKFTPEGGMIDVLAKSSDNKIKIIIKDNGLGIDNDFQPYIFDEFIQVDTSTTRKYKGLGLGLAISRGIIRLHQGDITVESAGQGKGTKFIVELPYEA